MGIGNIFKKVFSREPSKVHEKISPTQMELKTYINQDRIDTEKALLHEYRKKETSKLMESSFDSKNQILNAKDLFMGKQEKSKKMGANNNLFMR